MASLINIDCFGSLLFAPRLTLFLIVLGCFVIAIVLYFVGRAGVLLQTIYRFFSAIVTALDPHGVDAPHVLVLDPRLGVARLRAFWHQSPRTHRVHST